MVRVIGIKITDRIKEAGLVQQALSVHASVISTRMGFHELNEELCSREGFLIIHLAGQPDDCEKFAATIQNIEGISVSEMTFSQRPTGTPFPPTCVSVLGIVVPRQDDLGVRVQKILTAYGCVIRTRLGVNEVLFGEPAGLIILELTGDRSQFASLESDLRGISEIAVGRICFPA